MNTFSWTRVGHLLRYDWAIDKGRYRTTCIIVLSIYFVLLFFTYAGSHDLWSQLFVPGSEFHSLPAIGMIASYIHTYFQYAGYVLIFVATATLHRKFTDPQTATGYLALPGSRLEKFVAQCLHYAAAIVAGWGLYLVAFYVTMLLGQIFLSDMGLWLATNPFRPVAWSDFVEGFTAGARIENDPIQDYTGIFEPQLGRIWQLSFWMVPFGAASSTALYAVLNMRFRHSGQLKTIAIFVAATFLLIVLSIIGTVMTAHYFTAHAPTGANPATYALAATLRTIFTVVETCYWLLPVAAAGLCWLFYRQVERKQAK